MLPQSIDGLRPEVFIAEYNGDITDSVFHNYNYVDEGGNLRSQGQLEVQVPELSTGFHTVGLLWRPEELLYYVNGQPTHRIVGENVPSEDMYLILSHAAGGVWPGAPDGTTPFPAAFNIDYIRVYQLTDR